MIRIGLIPLDERPANTRDPKLIAEAAGINLILPPSHLLSRQHQPGNCSGLAGWLEQVAPKLDGLIVSCEQLGYGGLIASRTTDEPPETISQRLSVLRRIRDRFPHLYIYGFNLITRVSNASDASEEPAYWAEYGTAIYHWSQILDQVHQGALSKTRREEAERAIPATYRSDVLRRRLRNHLINLTALQLLNDGIFDLLVLSSDDTSPFGLPSREKRWLHTWAELLPLQERLLMYPGADEVGSVLTIRMALTHIGLHPAVSVRYAPPTDAMNIAAFEDGPIRLTVERQITAAGCQLIGVPEIARIWLGVNAPIARRAEWNPVDGHHDRMARQAAIENLVTKAGEALVDGKTVAFADVAYPNGADPLLIELITTRLDPTKLAAYGGWNTAGNTIGGVIAQTCATLIGDRSCRIAQERLLLHRFIEDYGYQHIVRREIREWLQTTYNQNELTPELRGLAATRVEQRLNEIVTALPGFAYRWRILPGSVHFPWQRVFEIDFTLHYLHEKGGDN